MKALKYILGYFRLSYNQNNLISRYKYEVLKHDKTILGILFHQLLYKLIIDLCYLDILLNS